MTELFDVAIIGGGCAGSTAATLLAKMGYQVLIVEQEKFPRYHIGESLVPGSIPILEELGLLDEMEKHAFVEKKGATFVWGRERIPWTVSFKDGYYEDVDEPYLSAFQVVRSEFDYMLLNNARRSGVTVLEETRVSEVIFEDGRYRGLHYLTGNNDNAQFVRSKFLIDASGQNAFLSRKLGLRVWDEQLKNIAVWAYYQGGGRYGGENAGNILIENTPNGWFWVIPLHDGTHSVGLVTQAANVTGRQKLEQLYLDTIALSGETKRLLARARRTSDFHTARDWSYKSTSFYGSGFLLAGDAAGFVDPLFSSGVFLAMNGGRLAAKTIDGLLQEPEKEEEFLERYEKSYGEFFDTVVSLVHYFYEASNDKESYWKKAQELIDPFLQVMARQDFIRLISATASTLPLLQHSK